MLAFTSAQPVLSHAPIAERGLAPGSLRGCAGSVAAPPSSAASAGCAVAAAAAVAAGAAALSARRRAGGSRKGLRRARAAVRLAAAKGPGGAIETFLVKGKVDISKLSLACAPLANYMDLTGLVFFSLGVDPKVISAVAGGGLGIHGVCPVYVADCYGIVGWDKASKANMEIMEEGRGSEYGKAGGKGGAGVVVVAFRGKGHLPTEGEPAADRGVHMFVTADGKDDIPAPCGSVYGGVAKACYKLEHSGDLVPVPRFSVSSPAAAVTSFNDKDAGKAAAATLAALPSEGPPLAAGYFPCFCRGVNLYGEDGVEPAEFSTSGLEDVKLFGMFAHGEIGPPKGAPVKAEPSSPSAGVEVHSETSVLALYAR